MASNAERLAAFRWKPGQSGNPAGPGKGWRKKLEEQFLKDLHDDWHENGKSAIEAARIEDPVGYLKTITAVIPKQIENLSEERLTRDELTNALAAIQSLIDATGVDGGTENPRDRGQTLDVSPVPEAG
jgi:Family of unknown function (DUF5681)